MQYETFEGGSAGAELEVFDRLARDLVRVQDRNRARSGRDAPDRAFHAKAVLALDDARLLVEPNLPARLRQECFQPGFEFRVTVRFSNASPIHQPDARKDMRGVALRIDSGRGDVHDLLLTNYPVSPAANAREFVAMAQALAGTSSELSKLVALVVKLPPKVGLRAAARIIGNLRKSATVVDSLAHESYWSRGAIRWGSAGPVRYLLRPKAAPAVEPAHGEDRLEIDFARRLAAGDVEFELALQEYVSELRTPVEDTSVPWDVPAVPVARLVLPRQHPDLNTELVRLAARRIERLAFNPWNTTEEFRPLGGLNRARRAAYEASSAHRMGYRFEPAQPRLQTAAVALAGPLFRLLNRFVPWHRLPSRLGVLNLALLRRQLRRENLIDTAPRPTRVEVRAPDPPPTVTERRYRSFDGTHTDLSAPAMGAVGAPFGRNMPTIPGQSGRPDPIRVSAELLARDRFIPARSLNVLAAAWIQFQVHDWVQHRRSAPDQRSITLPMPPGRTWVNVVGGQPVDEMSIAADDRGGNAVSHWWDGSEVYGPDAATAARLRVDGDGACLRLDNGYLPMDETGAAISGRTEGWWLGLSVIQTLMAREHNAVCHALSSEYPHLSEEQTYQTARLIVSALIAKIHTVEWTPAILGSKTIETGMKVNWRGAPRDLLTRLGLRLFDPHAMTGMPGSKPDHHGVPFALTEEFVAVYRMHPLIPDDFVFVDHAQGTVKEALTFDEIQGNRAETMLRKVGLADAIYSLGLANPGAVTLHNYPRALRELVRDGEIIDLAVVDIVRTRARGVPRYNDFRAAVHRPRIREFSELTTDPVTLARLAALYGSVDEIDTVVGLLAENPPKGFGFSDTAFRIFLLMASRRIQSDRFLTVDYRPEIYTPLGMDWVERGSFTGVLLRHCPELAEVAGRGKAVFGPW